jgi:hypothetical protein
MTGYGKGQGKRGVMFESIVNVKKKMITQIRRGSQRREQSRSLAPLGMTGTTESWTRVQTQAKREARERRMFNGGQVLLIIESLQDREERCRKVKAAQEPECNWTL